MLEQMDHTPIRIRFGRRGVQANGVVKICDRPLAEAPVVIRDASIGMRIRLVSVGPGQAAASARNRPHAEEHSEQADGLVDPELRLDCKLQYAHPLIPAKEAQ